MSETVTRYWGNLKQYWDKFSQTQKITFIATIILFLLTISIVTYNLSKTEYALAFTDLPAADAAAITSYLDNAKIPYRLSADGKSIGVPRNQAAEVKIGVESQGLNQNGSLGYGAFKQSSFGMTDNEFKIKHLEAIQGELQQLINANVAISSSKVLINLPEESVFVRERALEQATASVVLQIKPGHYLDQNKIDTIYNLVSHSLPNLPIENITISDQYTNQLVYSKTEPGHLSAATLANQQFQVNNQFRSDIEKNVTSLLSKFFGPDKIIVSVVSTMNFDQKRSHQSLVEPVNLIDQKGIEISLQEISKSYIGESTVNGGVAGTGLTDIPSYPGTSDNGRSSSEENERIVNYEVNRIINDIESAPYIVKDLTINVGIEPPDINNADSLGQETSDQVERILVNIVRAALADSGREYTEEELGKKVSVFAHQFASTAPAPAMNANMNWLYAGAGALAVALVGGGAAAAVARRRRAARIAQEQIETPTTRMEYPTIDLDQETAEQQARKQLETLAKRKPEEFANLLRAWLVDE